MRSQAAGMAVVLVPAGCSGGSGSPNADPDTTVSTPTTTAAIDDEPPDPVEVRPSNRESDALMIQPDEVEREPPDLSGATLGLSGLGPLQIGVSVNELAALGYEVVYADCNVPYIRFEPNGLVAVRGGANGDPSAEETLTGLYFWFGTPDEPDERNRGLRTHLEIGEGSTRADVLATYGDRVVERSVEIEDYLPDAQTLEDRIEFVPVGAVDAHPRMIFSFDDEGFLRGIRSGEVTVIQNPYLCA